MHPLSIRIKTFNKITPLLFPIKSQSLCFFNAEKPPSDSPVSAQKLANSFEWCHAVHSLSVGHFKAGAFDEVLRVYLNFRQRKVGIHGSAFTLCLKSCIQLCRLDFGKAIHVDILKFGLNTDRFVGSSLIGFYAVCKDMVDARKVFDEIAERDIVAYTSLITGYTRSNDHHAAYKAFALVQCMMDDNLEPNRVTLVSLLQAASNPRLLNHGESVHAYAVRRGVSCFDEVFKTSLMDMYVKCGALHKAALVFSQISTKTTACWNVLINGYLKSCQPFEALNLFLLMGQEGHKFDLISLANGVLSCANLGLLRVGKSIHGYMFRTEVQLDVVTNTSLIDMYSKCNSCEKAREIFDAMKDKDVISYNVLMAGYLHNGHAREAIKSFHNMRRFGLTENEATVLTIVSAYSDLKDVRQGRSIHGFVITHGFESKTDVANQVMYLYVKCEHIDYARQVFDQIKHKDLVSWTSMMMGYENLGHANKVITLFYKMTNSEKQHNPDLVTLTCLLQAFSRLGCVRQIKEIHCHVIRASMENEITIMNSLLTNYSKCGLYKTSKELFGQMGTKCIASWNTMIAASGMHGDCVGALDLINQMKKQNVVPDDVTFMSALSSCSHAGLVEEGLNLFKMMTEEYGLVPGEEHYGCVVDLLGRAGQLKEAFDFLKCVPARQSGSALCALVSACRVHGNSEMGEVLGRWLLDFDPENSRSYGLVSSLYAESERWSEAARIRVTAKQRGLKTTTGCSMIETDR
ncbi:hypothetical protein QVD17_36730 [Tagetes erecta]|uniref:Pentatricopeptide repeat-containing protein n=1 Tax=Tagetes erecta TaxID=13708 RepID=A0AAD8JSV3_TARER|nr:hypothetical protein QVD17_36730 [Tagetes erecta]